MPSIRSLLLVTLPLWQSTFAQDLSEPSPTTVVDEPIRQTFEDVLHALPAQSLHAALHNLLHPKFQDGVYEDEHDALAQVHSEDPTLASKLLEVAKLELAKRQAGGSNSTTTTSGDDVTTTPSNPPPTSTDDNGGQTTTTEPTSTPPTSSDNNRESSTPPPPPPPPPPPQTSSSSTPAVVVPIETSSTDAQGSVITVTSQSQAPGAVVTTTDAAGQSVETTSPVPTFQPSSSRVMTTTDARGSSVVTTAGGGAVSSLVLETTTLSGGQRSTRTSFVSVLGTPSDDAGVSGATTSSRNPSLQNGAPPPLGAGKGVFAALGAGVLGAVAMI